VSPDCLIVTEDVRFHAGPFLLHGELCYPESGRGRAAVVIAGPHPLLGGNMHNNVVRGLSDGLAQSGFVCLRFDYRGVGRSEGPEVDVARHMAEFWRTSHVAGEIDLWRDVQATCEFLRPAAPGLPFIAIGYSFGCALLPYLVPQADLAALVLIAPTVGKHDYSSYQTVRCPMLLVASEEDFAIDTRQLDAWYSDLTMPRQLVRRRCDNHFFRGHEAWLTETVVQFLDNRLR
jgi:alpha/beta superfamily hydrolase